MSMRSRARSRRIGIGAMPGQLVSWRPAASHTDVLVRKSAAPAAVRANPLEFSRREAGPAHEGAREMGLIGVPEVERDLDDLAGRIVEHPLRNRASDSRD